MSLILRQPDLAERYQVLSDEIYLLEEGFPTDAEKARINELEKTISELYEVAKARYQ